MSPHPLRCRCGTLRGHVGLPAFGRAVCYCKDCRAYACFLRREREVLDDAGGTQIVATLPQRVRFEPEGLDALACVSLSERGILRWYASCCNTPIGNTARNARIPYVSLVHDCLRSDPSRSLEASFWPLRMRVNTQSATRPVAATPLVTLAVMLGSMKPMLEAWWDAGRRANPFFHAQTGEPIRTPRVLAADERSRLKAAAG
jgi:hypothetical protein